MVSEFKERLPDLKPPPQLDSPEQARFRLFDSITAFLKSASQKQPLVLVLDDLYWADQPSLLQFVARELGNGRLLLVGTYRDVELSRQHPLAETLSSPQVREQPLTSLRLVVHRLKLAAIWAPHIVDGSVGVITVKCFC